MHWLTFAQPKGLYETAEDQGPCILFYSGLVAQRMRYRSDFGFWWKGKGQEEVKKDMVNIVSLGVWGHSSLLWIAQSLEMEIACGGKEMAQDTKPLNTDADALQEDKAALRKGTDLIDVSFLQRLPQLCHVLDYLLQLPRRFLHLT